MSIKNQLKYGKYISIGLTYGLMFVLFLITENPSAFLFFFSLWSEIVVLVLMYSFKGMFSKNGIGAKQMNVLIGSVPLLFLSMFVLSFTSLDIDSSKFYDMAEYPILARPLLYYKLEVICILAGIIISYGVSFLSKKNSNQALEKMEISLLKQALLIWILAIVTIIIFQIIPESFHLIAVSSLPITRLSVELWLLKTGLRFDNY